MSGSGAAQLGPAVKLPRVCFEDVTGFAEDCGLQKLMRFLLHSDKLKWEAAPVFTFLSPPRLFPLFLVRVELRISFPPSNPFPGSLSSLPTPPHPRRPPLLSCLFPCSAKNHISTVPSASLKTHSHLFGNERCSKTHPRRSYLNRK